MISFLMAFVITAFVVAERFDDWRRMGTVPMVGTGSPQMLTYLVKDRDVGLILWVSAKSAAIKVAALPVSGNVGKLRDPLA